ncbi:Transketolase [compost metagenome]
MGDGEQAEGSVWEAAMAGAHYKLDNLIAIIDRNRLQISGSTEEVMGLDPLEDKWAAFGWHVVSIDGNEMNALVETFAAVPAVAGKPTLVMANTVKGKGVSFAENVPHWHHHVPNELELGRALAELTTALEMYEQKGEIR